MVGGDYHDAKRIRRDIATAPHFADAIEPSFTRTFCAEPETKQEIFESTTLEASQFLERCYNTPSLARYIRQNAMRIQ